MPTKPASTRQLLAQYAEILEQLRDKGVLRSNNNPVADYTEKLVECAMGLTLATNSTAGFDATDKVTGQRYQIKGWRISQHNAASKNPLVSGIRNLDTHRFDFLVGVVFGEDFTVLRAAKIPYATIKEVSTYKPHTNAHHLRLSPPLWNRPDVEDVTKELRYAQKNV